ncbi:hypothetical protein [Candidatus Spongiihabitans sp.]|uniref:hypothetical protein n=1 Tax=Candidatus Spongiihabitans sp. TaxID=3101308 RepID=UPI003C6F087B
MIQTNNYSNGHWVAGEDSVPNINPSDTRETIGEFAQASSVQVGKNPGGATRTKDLGGQRT